MVIGQRGEFAPAAQASDDEDGDCRRRGESYVGGGAHRNFAGRQASEGHDDDDHGGRARWTELVSCE